jgi:hypothetical protein
MGRTHYPLLENVGVNGDMWGKVDGVYAEIRAKQQAEHTLVTERDGEPVGYTYNADTYCPGCILFEVNYLAAKLEIAHQVFKPNVHDTLKVWAEHLGINMTDERSYDSGDWPKSIVEGQITFPEPCGRCLALFGMDPNEAPWCSACGCYTGECWHAPDAPKPEYRTWCENGDLHGFAEVENLGETWEVTRYLEDHSLIAAAGIGFEDDDFPHTMSFMSEGDAHRCARNWADALVKQARERDKAKHGEDAREDEHHVQTTDGAYLEN